jgi:TolB-like protein
VIIFALTLAVALLLLERYVGLTREANDPASQGTEHSETLEKTVAVLPFVAMSHGEDDRYFTDGLTEEIINALSQMPELRVTARTSSFYFKDRNVPIPEIAGQLGVAYLVEGSLRRDHDDIRITAQLVRATDGFHLWSQTYDHSGYGSFEVQTEIAMNVAAALEVVLDDRLLDSMRRVGVRDARAFIAYQKGIEQYEIAHAVEASFAPLQQANRYFERAIELEPAFYDAYKLHTDYLTHRLLDFDHLTQPQSTYQEILALLESDLETLVRLARDDQQFYSARFDQSLLSGDWRGLARINREMLQHKGCSIPVWPNSVSLFFGTADLALERFHVVRQCDPMRHEGWVWSAEALDWLGRPGEAIDIITEGLKVMSHPRLYRALVYSSILASRHDQAEALLEEARVSDSEAAKFSIMLAAARGAQGLEEGIAAWIARRAPSVRSRVSAYAWAGDREAANAAASEADAHPFGYFNLLNAIRDCRCGAPFDLEATPDFAERLGESGFAWPPPSPTSWPLKDW